MLSSLNTQATEIKFPKYINPHFKIMFCDYLLGIIKYSEADLRVAKNLFIVYLINECGIMSVKPLKFIISLTLFYLTLRKLIG